jgi:hypothetical protein
MAAGTSAICLTTVTVTAVTECKEQKVEVPITEDQWVAVREW